MPVSDHQEFDAPDDQSVKIWRYMDFTKFVSMLENGGLFFSRADLLGDPFEGSFPEENNEMRPMMTRFAAFQPEGDALAEKALKQLRDFNRARQRNTLVSCWHMNNYESAAMWQLYAKTNEAVAIRSTYHKLRDLLDDECHLGVVKYVDYDETAFSDYGDATPFVHKRLSFAHESELRAVILLMTGPFSYRGSTDFESMSAPPGVWKTLSLPDLIDDLFVAPTSPKWFHDLVSQVVERYELRKTVTQSRLDEEPFF